MKKLLLCVLLYLLAAPTQARTYQDWWVDSSFAGSSLNIAQQANTLFVAWYMYDQSHKPTWIYGVGTLSGTTASLTLYQATGQFLGAPQSVASTQIGSATLSFSGAAAAQMTYAFNGTSGVLNLTRFSFDLANASGDYVGGEIRTYSGCTNPAANATVIYTATYTINMSAAAASISGHYSNYSCTMSGSFTQIGSRIRIPNGTYTCGSGDTGTWHADEVQFDNDTFVAEIVSHSNSTGCSANGRVVGARIKTY